MRRLAVGLVPTALVVAAHGAYAQTGGAPPMADVRMAAAKASVVAEVEARRDVTQQIVDSLFSFSEIGYEELETQRYLGALLERNGFTVQRGVAGMPSGWVADLGSGRPVIALGADVDGVPTATRSPACCRAPSSAPGAPGHGEGHNAGPAVVITAALAAKAVMQRERLQGTLVCAAGIADELLAGKAFFVRAGVFKDVDAVLYAHVANALATGWGDTGMSGLIPAQVLVRGRRRAPAARRAP